MTGPAQQRSMDLCLCGKPAEHVDAPEDSEAWPCLVPVSSYVGSDERAAEIAQMAVDGGGYFYADVKLLAAAYLALRAEAQGIARLAAVEALLDEAVSTRLRHQPHCGTNYGSDCGTYHGDPCIVGDLLHRIAALRSTS